MGNASIRPLEETKKRKQQTNFSPDLSIAKRTELDVVALMYDVYKAESVSISSTSAYDLEVVIPNKGTFFIEIKEDFQCGRTGNMVLEFSSWNRLSGISTTRADVYIHKLHMLQGVEYWATNTGTLKKMIEGMLYTRIVNGGDKGSNSLNYLFPLDIFKSKSRRIF